LDRALSASFVQYSAGMLDFFCCACPGGPCGERETIDVAVVSDHASLPTLLRSGHGRNSRFTQSQEAKETSCHGLGEEMLFAGGSPDVQQIEHHGDRSAGGCADSVEEQPSHSSTSMARGRKCWHISEKTGLRNEVEYRVDVKSGQLVLKMIRSSGRQDMLSFPIMSIEDIFTIEDGEDCFPAPLMKSLSAEERAGLFIIEYTHDDGTSIQRVGVYLVEASRSARDELLQCLLQHVHAAASA